MGVKLLRNAKNGKTKIIKKEMLKEEKICFEMYG